MQIKTGYFDIVVIEAHSKISELLTYEDVVSLSYDPIYEAPLIGHPYVVAGLEMRKWMEVTNTSEEKCAAVVCKNKRNALKNPLAEYEAKITIEDVMNSEYLFDPIKQLDIAPRVDGAIVIVAAESSVAKVLTNKPVWVEGIGWSSDTPWVGERDPYANYIKKAAQKAYDLAGINNPKKDIDLLEIDDHFSFKEIQFLEALGFAQSGEGSTLLLEGTLERTGDLPTNVSGGSLGMGDLIEATGLQRALEIVLQLREEAGARQVRNARVGLAQSWRNLPHATGAVAILSRRD
jgi:acetyl-CoA C-acetyltransferase